MTDSWIYYLFILLTGFAFGSFFNVVICRIPAKESLLIPSQCPSCKRKILFYDNIPLISYLLLKGKCRYCSGKIHWHYPLVEIITPIIFLLTFIIVDNNFSLLFFKYIIFTSGCIIIFFTDIKAGIIPDLISLPLIVIGIIFSLFPGSDITTGSSLIGAVTGFILFLGIAVIYGRIRKKESLGGGDIKFIAAVGGFLGFIGLIFTILISSTLALCILIVSGHKKDVEFPYGPFLVIGSFIYIFLGKIMIDFYLSLFY